MSIKKIEVFDMDGVLVCSMHRFKTLENGKIDLDYWRANEYRAGDDTLLPMAAYYQECLSNPEIFVVIATARVLNDPDDVFIRDILGAPDFIISRGKNDTRKGAELKIKGLKKFFNLKPFKNAVVTMYEDNAPQLAAICDYFKIKGVYIPSAQGV